VPRGSGTVRFFREATADLKRAALWYEDHQAGLGKAFTDAVRRAVDLIALGPERWPVRRGTRRFALRRFPYTIAYRIDATGIVVLAVAHHRLDPSAWEGR